MKIVISEWLKVRKACVMLGGWFICNLAIVLISNSLIIKVSDVFGDIDNYQYHLTILVSLLAADLILSMIVGYLKTATNKHCFTVLMNKYCDKILDADYNMFTKYSIARINTAQEFISKIVSIGISTCTFFIRGFSIIVTLYTMYTIGGAMIIPVIIIYFIGFLIFKRIYKVYMEIDRNFQVIKKDRNQEFENIINGFTEVRSFGMTEIHRKSIHSKNNKIYSFLVKKAKINSIMYGSFDLIEGAGLTMVVIYTIKQLAAGLINQAQAMSLVMLVFKLIDPLIMMLDFVDELSDNLTLKDEYKKIVDYDHLIKDGSIDMESFEDKIKLQNVSFSYDNITNALTNINIEVRKGQKIGICGVSGGGKTTLFKLLNRFYDPNEGTITIDEIPIDQISLDSYRKYIGSVHQENTIFPGSIRENVMYGSKNATEDDLIHACKKAHIYEFITGLDKGFETEVGPRGLKLSGGQKQRIALARLFIRDPEIILLDEATSALDNESETIIQEAIDALHDKTIITIAHRLSTIKNCDAIYLMGSNGIIESGSHEELVAKKGAYYAMLK